jgi:hypothetical protein
MIKLNVGASPIWEKDGWHTLDHKFRDNTSTSLVGDASKIPLKDNSCSTVFTSHMFEHIPHVRLENILIEFNRVLSEGGVVRILTPDLKKIAKAYANDDLDFFKLAKEEDENIRTDLGTGGMFMNFIVSPGQDTALFNRNLDEFIAGYAHLYCYDFLMLKTLLERTGFNEIKQMEFCKSTLIDYTEPLHVTGLDSEWKNFNQEFYKKNNLTHYYDAKEGKYNIDFTVTGFDRDPITSLIIEAKKDKHIDKSSYVSLNESKSNYNRYAWSLMKDDDFVKRHDDIIKLSKNQK